MTDEVLGVFDLSKPLLIVLRDDIGWEHLDLMRQVVADYVERTPGAVTPLLATNLARVEVVEHPENVTPSV